MTRALLLIAALAATPALAIFGIETDPDKIEEGWKKEKLEALASDSDPKERAAAAKWLGGRDDPEAVSALAAALSDPDARVRQAAASGLWSTGKKAASARPQLEKALDDSDANVVARVTGALEATGMKEAELVAPNKRVFNAPEATIDSRFLVSRSLVGREPNAKILDAQLAYLADNASSKSRAGQHNTAIAREALEYLVKKTQDPALGPPLLEAARTARAGQPEILHAIAQLKAKPPGLAQVAVQLCDSPDRDVRYAALGAMRPLTTKADVDIWAPRAAALLHDPESLVRVQAATALGYGAGLAAAHVDAVVEALHDSSGSVRRDAAETIGKMGDKTQAVPAATKARVAEVGRPALLAIAESDPNEDVRREAKSALAKLGTGGGGGSAVAAAAPGARSEADGMAVLRARKVTFEEASFYRALSEVDVDLVRAFLDAGMSPKGPLVGLGAPIRVMLFAGSACSPRERPTSAATVEITRMLLERGADPNEADANGNTPLMEAASKGCDRAYMKMLIKAGARIDATNAAKLTPFEMGLYSGSDGLEELVAAGYRLPPEKAKMYSEGYKDKPASLALIRKASAAKK
jgi:HEAT repeat protein